MSKRRQPGSSRTEPWASPRLAALNCSANPGLILIVTKIAYIQSPSQSRAPTEGGEEVDFAVLPHVFEEPELARLAIHHDGHARHDNVLFLVVEFRLQARKGALEVLNHLADRVARHVDLLLPPRQRLQAGGKPYVWHDDLPIVSAIGSAIFLQQGHQNTSWGHGERVESCTSSTIHRIGDRGQRWNDASFTHATHPVGMGGI